MKMSTGTAAMRGQTHGQTTQGRSNRLALEKSPYLLQHANNPVDWFPWGDEAFDKARREDKPIFLSIGYSTCHWCHVMAHESFQDPEVAKLMNEAFVSIKVDREERPDIDGVYMTVCQMMTGSGGWPLTVLMTPERKPFFAGTYFPKTSRFGRIGMLELVPRVKELWHSDRQELLRSSEQITVRLRDMNDFVGGEELGVNVIETAARQLSRSFDEDHGGFGSAPKFPTPHNLSLLLRNWKRTGDSRILEIVESTLQAMRRGGIHDHVGFGFHRYSTDKEWLVPHFEKMLYDQALLAIAYIEAFQATGKEEYAQTAREIFIYVLGEMTSPEGGFYSAQDADSDGEEGKFYVWTEAELIEVLGIDDAALAGKVFGVRKEGNFKEEATGKRTGANILHLNKRFSAIAEDLGQEREQLALRLESIRERLFLARKGRVHPHKDDKILADWNGLMIAALAKGARVLDDGTYAAAAEKASRFILEMMEDSDGRLVHRYRDGESGISAHIDDYSFMIWGLLELYESTFDPRHLQNALQMNEELLGHFWDEKSGGFFFTANDSESLLVRQKEIYDGAVPSGNSVAMLNLIRLSRITSNTDLERRAESIARVFSKQVKRSPSGFTQLLVALDFALGPSHEVVLTGVLGREDTENMIRALNSRFLPSTVVMLRPDGEGSQLIDRLTGVSEVHSSLDGEATAYVCENFTCNFPTTEVKTMLKLLDGDG